MKSPNYQWIIMVHASRCFERGALVPQEGRYNGSCDALRLTFDNTLAEMLPSPSGSFHIWSHEVNLTITS
jgi:hypothetical protein